MNKVISMEKFGEYAIGKVQDGRDVIVWGEYASADTLPEVEACEEEYGLYFMESEQAAHDLLQEYLEDDFRDFCRELFRQEKTMDDYYTMIRVMERVFEPDHLHSMARQQWNVMSWNEVDLEVDGDTFTGSVKVIDDGDVEKPIQLWWDKGVFTRQDDGKAILVKWSTDHWYVEGRRWWDTAELCERRLLVERLANMFYSEKYDDGVDGEIVPKLEHLEISNKHLDLSYRSNVSSDLCVSGRGYSRRYSVNEREKFIAETMQNFTADQLKDFEASRRDCKRWELEKRLYRVPFDEEFFVSVGRRGIIHKEGRYYLVDFENSGISTMMDTEDICIKLEFYVDEILEKLKGVAVV